MAKNLLFIFLSLAAVFAEIEEEEGVWVLTESNFEEALSLQPELLVEFYAPWCGHCKTLAPEYAKAARRLAKSDPPVKIAKVDATENKDLAQKYKVGGYPTLKYIVNGEATDYNGGRTEDAIYSYVIKRLKPSVTVLEAGCNLEEILSSSKVNVLYFGEIGGHDYEVFEKVSKAVDGASFFATSASEIIQKYDSSEGRLVLLKDFDDKRNDFEGTLEFEDLKKWISESSRPTVIEFDQKAIELIFRESNAAIFLFSKTYEDFQTDFEKLAKEYKGKLLFCKADLFTTDNGRLAQFLGLSGEEQPTSLILDVPKGLVKHKLSGTPNYESLKTFLEDWFAGSLSAYFKSQEVPAESHENNVRVLVSKNFNEVVLDSKKDVLVEFYAPWCGHCKSLAPEYERLATDLKDVSTLVIAKMDSTENEVKGISIASYPTLKFYPANNKEAVSFDGERNYEGLLEFIKQNSYFEVENVKTDL